MPRNGQPVDPETRARVVALMGEGVLGRNAIARETGVSGWTVTMIAQEIGHTFDRRNTELAVAARTVDLAKERQELAAMLMVEVRQSLEDMRAPATMVQFEGGHQLTESEGEGDERVTRTRWVPGEWREHVIPEPTFSDKRNLMTIVGIGITKIAELTKATEAAGSETAVSYLDNLTASLEVARAAIMREAAARGASAAEDAPVVDETDPTVVPTGISREELLAEYEQQVAAETDTEANSDDSASS